jgi:hypothetical protein
MGGDYTVAARAPEFRHGDPYVQWVADNHLALAPTLEGHPPDVKRWDTLTIASITEDIATPHGVPPIFAMFNVLKADYLVARWLAYLAESDKLVDSGFYSDTLDYANYGTHQSLLTLAQRSAVDILDRLAVAVSEYLELPGSARDIYFRSRWHVMEGRQLKKPLQWQPEVASETALGNFSVIALAEVAEDVAAGGSLEEQQLTRHATTHRFVILHDMMVGGRESPYMERWQQDAFGALTLDVLQHVRAAIMYLLQLITWHEHHKHSSGTVVLPLDVLPDDT